MSASWIWKSHRTTSHSRGNKRVALYKGGFGKCALVPVFWYRRSVLCTLVPCFGGPSFHCLYPRSGFLVQGNIPQNHPFGNHPFANPRHMFSHNQFGHGYLHWSDQIPLFCLESGKRLEAPSRHDSVAEILWRSSYRLVTCEQLSLRTVSLAYHSFEWKLPCCPWRASCSKNPSGDSHQCHARFELAQNLFNCSLYSKLFLIAFWSGTLHDTTHRTKSPVAWRTTPLTPSSMHQVVSGWPVLAAQSRAAASECLLTQRRGFGSVKLFLFPFTALSP